MRFTQTSCEFGLNNGLGLTPTFDVMANYIFLLIWHISCPELYVSLLCKSVYLLIRMTCTDGGEKKPSSSCLPRRLSHSGI